MKLLVVDGSKLFPTVIGKICADCDSRAPVVVAGFQEGLARLQQESFDLICVALHLSDGDGVEFGKQVRSLAEYKLTPLYLLTSDRSSEWADKATEAGITEVYDKYDLDRFAHGIKVFITSFYEPVTGRALIVEDNREDALLVSQMLEQHNIEFAICRTCDDANKLMREELFDVIILDVVFKVGLSSFSFIRQIRAHGDDARKALPIMAMSSFDDLPRRIELFRLGINDFMAKPPAMEEFIARIRNLINTKKLHDEVLKSRQRLHEMAMTDQLTGLLNRHSIEEFGGKTISQAYRRKQALSLLVVDLDKFKNINDNFGHLTGDTVLREVGALLKESFRKGDVVARIGGEEFVVLLPDCPPGNALDIAEKTRTSIEQLKPADLEVTASIGVANLLLGEGAVPQSYDDLFKLADDAVYKAKGSGRNKVVVSE